MFGNVRSVRAFLLKCGYVEVENGGTPDILVLNGVGSYSNLPDIGELHNRANDLISDHPGSLIVGICLGFHLMCLGSEEGESRQHGFGVFNAPVKKLPLLNIGKKSVDGDGVRYDAYFQHLFGIEVVGGESFGAQKLDTVEIGGKKFVAAARKDNFLGFQFHPELSGSDFVSVFKDKVSE